MAGGLREFLQPHAAVGDYVFFKLVSDYLDRKIVMITQDMMERSILWVSLVALSVMTIWIMIVGYQMVSGSFRGSMTSLMTDMGKKIMIIGVATSMALFGTDLHGFVTNDIDKAVNELVTGEKGTTTSAAIDENLVYMQLAFTAIDAIEVTDGDQELREEKTRALMFAGFGTSSPALTAGAMLIFFKFIIMFFIGLGPIFILLLFFQSTKDMFRRWLQFGVAAIFAKAGLSLVTAIVLELTVKIAFAFWGAKAINGAIGADPEGLTSQAMQQGGIGLLLTVTIISVPTALAAFFGGLAGNGFLSASAFAGGSAASNMQQSPPPRPAAPPAPNSAEPAEVNHPRTLPGLQAKTPPINASTTDADAVKNMSDVPRRTSP